MTDLFSAPLVNTPTGKQKPVKAKETALAAHSCSPQQPPRTPYTPLRPYTVLKVSRDETWILNE